MADGLAEALLGLNVSPAQSPYALGQQALAQATPSLITPYTPTGQAIGISLGSVLLQSLLGYQARSQAAQDTLQANTLANKMMEMTTPQARTEFIGGVEDPMQQARLSALATALTTQEKTRENQVNLVSGLEVAKLKAVGDFYSTPAGKAIQEQEIANIKAKAIAGRTPLEDYLAREDARKAREMATESLKQTGRINLQNIKDAAQSGREEDKRTWSEKQKEIDRDLKQKLVGLSVDAAVEKKRKIDELTMENRRLGQDPNLALVNAKAQIAKELANEKEAASGRLIEKAAQEREQEAVFKRNLELANPKAPAALVTQNVKRISASNMAVDLADEIERYHNWITYRVGTAFSAADEAGLRAGLLKLSAEERLALSGTATNESERKDINEMLNGDFSAGPETKAMLLRRFAETSRKVAVDNMKGGFASASDFIKSVEQGLQSGGRIEFNALTGIQSQNTAVSNDQLIAQLNALEAKLKDVKAKKGLK